MTGETIHVHRARVNNLKNVSVDIPRNQLVVITGLSGSGKSSLAFDTLYAEGQRRYVESLNAYARQFLGRMSKPECDYITGIPPAIAIEQKVISRNPRSTVGTSTEIYEYLRLLYARIGHTFSPISGHEVRKHSTEDVVQCMLSYSSGTRFTVLCPIRMGEGRTLEEQLKAYLQEGYTRLDVNGEMVRIEDFLATGDLSKPSQRIMLLIDRLSVSDAKETISRLVDSAETAFYEGRGEMTLRFLPAGIEHVFSTRFEADGMTFEEPTDQLFAFNSPLGACPTCEGWGSVTGIDPQLVIPNSALSVYEGCVVCWRGEKMSEWKNEFIRMAESIQFPIFKPYYELTLKEKDLLWHGRHAGKGLEERWMLHDVCIDLFFDYLREGRYKIQNRVMLARYTGKTECPDCHGSRLKPEASYVKVAGRAITELVDMPITELKRWFDNLELNEHDAEVAKRLLVEINSRLQFLLDVGLGYLTLGRRSNSLSGGESQRINLATSLGSSLVGSLYILDEPSIGLHSRDTDRLIKVLRQLVDLGNTVVVVEHDEEMIRAADYIIDIGPEAGRLGGEVVWEGRVPEARLAPDGSLDIAATGIPQECIQRSHTLKWLLGLETLEGETDGQNPPAQRAGAIGAGGQNTPAQRAGAIGASMQNPPAQRAGAIGAGGQNTPAQRAGAIGGGGQNTPAQGAGAIGAGMQNPPAQRAGAIGGGGQNTPAQRAGASLSRVHRASSRFIEVKGARANNLRGIDVKFPLNVMTCVTGVSGSGKSTLVRDIFYRALKREMDEVADRPGEFIGLEGDIRAVKAVEFVDQNPIGKSSRSNPVIYVKAYDEIRKLFADQPLAKQMGFTASYFSFNTEGGRCEECKGEGTVTIEMQFMADLVLECESCHGQRFKSDVLDVRFQGQNINDVLNMTVNQAMEFFGEHGEKKIVKRLKPLQDVGLGYIKLGQSSSTLSGGENQRVKLAYYIGMEKAEPTLFIFDEPTTGLHFHDIAKLLASFDALIERGHTIVVIEHNLDVIRMADHIIDLGPEGGAAGGNVVVTGTPEEVAACADSYTGRFLCG